jgi:hypothetical protein
MNKFLSKGIVEMIEVSEKQPHLVMFNYEKSLQIRCLEQAEA